MEKLLSVNDLSVDYRTNTGLISAVRNVSLEIGKNELLAVVGESGCGKSTLGLSIIGLLPKSSVNRGSMDYKGTDLMQLNQNQMRTYRGTEIAMIFQEPLTSLNPAYRVSYQIAEAISLRKLRKEQNRRVAGNVMQKVYRSDAMSARFPRVKKTAPPELRSEIIDWLKLVRIADPEQVLDRYPFELSGGMVQRVMIAMALSEEPTLLIADEPTTALDVTTQAQVLRLMHELMDKVDTSILLVTHDLAVASEVADRVAVMYAGEIAEDADVLTIFSEPLHPYTKGLLSCLPAGTKDSSTLRPIHGSVPDMARPPTGCSFESRCPYAFDRCSAKPQLKSVGENHKVACFLHDN